MILDEDQLRALVERPGETLNVEVKRWLDLSQPEGIAKIVKAAFALRNRDGGFIVVGFDDKTLQPDSDNRPADVRAFYHQDIIQSLISRYAHEPFEIQVSLVEHGGHLYPVIAIAQGVRVPVVVKNGLNDARAHKLLATGDVYFRTLNANGTPSSATARPQDWRDILEVCFNNREADIGQFLRRHLTGEGVQRVVAALQGESTTDGDQLRRRSHQILQRGEEQFENALKERGTSIVERVLYDLLSWEIALAIDPPKTAALPDREFLAGLAASNPRYTGWPIWLDARQMTDERSRPMVRAGAWEALVVGLSDETANRFEFMRLDPRGDFYLRRLLQDDAVPQRIKPGERFDPILMIYRLTEALAVGIAIAKGLGWQETATLGFMFRWKKLKGRRLDSWANPMVYIPGGGPAQQDDITTFIEFPLATAPAAISGLVEAATQELFVAFDGTRLSKETYEEQTRRLLERRMN